MLPGLKSLRILPFAISDKRYSSITSGFCNADCIFLFIFLFEGTIPLSCPFLLGIPARYP